jgi:hypothetical protein
MHYVIDDFTDPWRKPETIVLHHGNCKSTRFWYRWVPILPATTGSCGWMPAGWAGPRCLRRATSGR